MGNLPLPLGDGLGSNAEEFTEYGLAHSVLPTKGADSGGYAESVHDGSFLSFKFGVVGAFVLPFFDLPLWGRGTTEGGG